MSSDHNNWYQSWWFSDLPVKVDPKFEFNREGFGLTRKDPTGGKNQADLGYPIKFERAPVTGDDRGGTEFDSGSDFGREVEVVDNYIGNTNDIGSQDGDWKLDNDYDNYSEAVYSEHRSETIDEYRGFAIGSSFTDEIEPGCYRRSSTAIEFGRQIDVNRDGDSISVGRQWYHGNDPGAAATHFGHHFDNSGNIRHSYGGSMMADQITAPESPASMAKLQSTLEFRSSVSDILEQLKQVTKMCDHILGYLAPEEVGKSSTQGGASEIQFDELSIEAPELQFQSDESNEHVDDEPQMHTQMQMETEALEVIEISTVLEYYLAPVTSDDSPSQGKDDLIVFDKSAVLVEPEIKMEPNITCDCLVCKEKLDFVAAVRYHDIYSTRMCYDPGIGGKLSRDSARNNVVELLVGKDVEWLRESCISAIEGDNNDDDYLVGDWPWNVLLLCRNFDSYWPWFGIRLWKFRSECVSLFVNNGIVDGSSYNINDSMIGDRVSLSEIMSIARNSKWRVNGFKDWVESYFIDGISTETLKLWVQIVTVFKGGGEPWLPFADVDTAPMQGFCITWPSSFFASHNLTL